MHTCSFPASDGKQLHSRANVLVLRTRRVRSFDKQIPLVEEILDDPPTHPVHVRLDLGDQRYPIGMRLSSLDAVRPRGLHALLHRPIRKLLRQSLHREGQTRISYRIRDALSRAHVCVIGIPMTNICLQGKQVYAEKRLERIRAAEKMSMSMQLDDAVSNGKVANGHANGHANSYTNETSKKKTQ